MATEFGKQPPNPGRNIQSNLHENSCHFIGLMAAGAVTVEAAPGTAA
jgi:hypothetical protein